MIAASSHRDLYMKRASHHMPRLPPPAAAAPSVTVGALASLVASTREAI